MRISGAARGTRAPRGAAGMLILGLLAAPGAARAQGDRPSDEDLRSLQERGHAIFLYLQAADRAAELLKTQGSNAPSVDRVVVITDKNGWRIDYLKELAKETGATGAVSKGLALVAETTFSPDAGEVGTLGLIVPPHSAGSSIQAYAHALEEAEGAVAGRPDAGRPFEDAVLRESDGTFTVYVMSQRPVEGVASPSGSLVVGRDFVVRLTATGRQVLSVDKLHESLSMLSELPRPPGTPLLHEHDKGDLPTPTDLALVLRHQKLAPLLVLTPRWMFRVDQAAAVTWLGANPNPKKPAAPAASAPATPGGTAPGAAVTPPPAAPGGHPR